MHSPSSPVARLQKSTGNQSSVLELFLFLFFGLVAAHNQCSHSMFGSTHVLQDSHSMFGSTHVLQDPHPAADTTKDSQGAAQAKPSAAQGQEKGRIVPSATLQVQPSAASADQPSHEEQIVLRPKHA